MSLNPERHWWLIPASLVFAMLWQFWPFGRDFRLVAPDAIVTVMLYWTLRKPQTVNSGWAFTIGLLRDAAEGTPLGMHALAMTVICYIAQLLYNPMRLFALWQQALTVTALGCLYLFIGNWVVMLDPGNQDKAFLLVPAFSTGLCWPFCFLVLKHMEQGFLRAPVRS